MPEQFPCILLVEDDPGDAHLALAVLRELDLAQYTSVVHTGDEALDWLYRRRRHIGRPAGNPTLVVLDVKLPGISGLEVLAEMRADPRFKFVAVVMFSASRQECDLQKAYELGANAYVVKAIDFATFKSRLTGLLEFWTAANELPSAV